jgi:hypothetical protein
MAENRQEIIKKMLAELKTASALTKKIQKDSEVADQSVDEVDKEDK